VPPLPLPLPIGAALCAAPLAALTRPRTATVLLGVSAVALPLLTSPTRDLSWPWPWSVPSMIAFVVLVLLVASLHGWRSGIELWVVGMAGSLLVAAAFPGEVPSRVAGPDLLVTASLTGAALLIGTLVAGRVRLGAELTRERAHSAAEQEKRVLIEERTRIARELHDVIAHTTSLIQVQASTARYRIPELPEAATAEFEEIAETARGSLLEMRRLLGVLRTEDHAPELSPQRGVEDVRELVDRARRAGAEVSLSLAAAPEDLPPSLRVAAFRITQEALSNAVRHAPGAALEVDIAAHDGSLLVRVHNGPATGPPAPGPGGTGHGLRGMQERAGLLGGSLLAAPGPGGGWTVMATLPIADPTQEDPS